MARQTRLYRQRHRSQQTHSSSKVLPISSILPTRQKIVPKDETPKVPFPWSAFLSQQVFDPKRRLILNPSVFQQVYQVRLLESCLHKRLPANRYPKLSG